MPRYHFNIYDEKSHIDVDGLELADAQAARPEGLCAFGAIIRDEGLRADSTKEWRLEITDAAGLVLFRMDFTVFETPAVERRGLPN